MSPRLPRAGRSTSARSLRHALALDRSEITVQYVGFCKARARRRAGWVRARPTRPASAPLSLFLSSYSASRFARPLLLASLVQATLPPEPSLPHKRPRQLNLPSLPALSAALAHSLHVEQLQQRAVRLASELRCSPNVRSRAVLAPAGTLSRISRSAGSKRARPSLLPFSSLQYARLRLQLPACCPSHS